MKKSARTLIASSVAVALGALLLVGGAGSLAFWSDAETGTVQQIQSGTLDLGTVGLGNVSSATIKQCTTAGCTTPLNYGGGAIVPGDVIAATINVPVKLIGQNMKAKFSIAPKKTAGATGTVANAADIALAAAVTVKIKKVETTEFPTAIADASQSVQLGAIGERTVPVLVEVTFPWGATAGDYNAAMGGKLSLGATYTLEQIAA